LQQVYSPVIGISTPKDYRIMQRPTSVTVFGILNIVFAVFGFCGVLGIVAVFTAAFRQQSPEGFQPPVSP
jgi:hypothetical protein